MNCGTGKHLVFIFFFMVFLSCFAESDYGGYGALSFKYSPINDSSYVWGKGDSGALIGMRGGWIFDKKYELGVAAYTLIPERDVETRIYSSNPDNDTIARREQSFGYAGITGFYLYPLGEMFSISLGGLLGGGGHRLEGEFYDPEKDEYSEWDTDIFFVAEPEIAVDADFFRMIRLSVGVSYRAVLGIDDDAYIKAGPKDQFFDNSDFAGFVFMSQIKFGKF